MDTMYYGDILVVDLDSGKTGQVEFERQMLEQSGPGLASGMALLREHVEGEPLVLGSGLLTGTTAPASCLGFALGASPVTGEPAVAPLSQYAGSEMKLSGFSMVVIKGKSAKPVYLWLHDGVADIVDASKLAGKDTWETTDAIRSDMGEHLIQVISTGPAGESGSRLASFSINYWGSGDTAGLGAVMGEKNLKAVALRGLGMLDAEEPLEFYRGTLELLSGSPAEKGFKATCAAVKAYDIDGWLKPLVHRYRSCFACPHACNTFVKYNEDHGVIDSTGVEEPGLLITGAAAPLWLQRGGWEVEPACRALEALCREGMDVVRGARELAGTPLNDAAEIRAAVKGLGGTEDAGWPADNDISYTGLFGPWVPPLSEEDGWVEANRAGYVLGICPAYILLSGIDVSRLFELCSPAAGIELDAGRIAEMFA